MLDKKIKLKTMFNYNYNLFETNYCLCNKQYI